MRYRALLAVILLFTWVLVIIEPPIDGDPFFSGFHEVAEDRFDDLGRPNFISASDWNDDGYVDLLVNGHRLYMNSGPPDHDYVLRADVFRNTTSGARNGVWGDIDGDGDLDLFQGCNRGTNDRIWRNLGSPDYHLEDVSSELLGSWENLRITMGASWADHDRDGDLDLYVECGEEYNDGDPIYYPDFLLRNDGSHFSDVTAAVGMRPTSDNFYSRGSTWGDFNNDGWQDLYVSHYRIRENHLFVNQQDGTFTEEGGIRNCSGLYDTELYYDATAGGVYGQYWWGPMYGHTIGSAWADLNNDGNLDIFTSDFVHKYVGYIGSWYDIRGYVCDDAKIYINDGAPEYSFTDYRHGSGISIWPIGGQGVYQGDQTFSGVTIGDYDNDGWQDIYIPQVYNNLPYTTPHLYHNKGRSTVEGRPDGTEFEDVTDALGIKGSDTYANLFLDYDNDGDLDLITGGGDTWDGSAWTGYRMRLYENQGTGSNSWLSVRLNGVGKNLNGIGGRIALRYGSDGEDRIMIREVRAGAGHAHQQGDVVHFGLGDVTSIDSLEVWWPDGVIQLMDGPSLDQLLVVDHPVDQPPEISGWAVSDDTPLEDTAITIVADGEGEITEYLWDLDGDNIWDRTTDVGSVNVTFHEEGLKHIRCRLVTASGTCTDIYPIPVLVENLDPQINVGDLQVSMDSAFLLGERLFSDTPSDLANISWEISWEDGSVDLGMGPDIPLHTYVEPEVYSVLVRCSDGTVTVEKRVMVSVENVAPWGYARPRDGNGTMYSEDESVNIEVLFFDTQSDPGNWVISWDLGDGSPSTPFSKNRYVWHSFSRGGVYNVTAYVKDTYGDVGELKGVVLVENVEPTMEEAYVGSSFVETYEDDRLEFDHLVKGGDTPSDRDDLLYMWDFGDGSSNGWYGSPDASHVYTTQGVYNALCTVKDDDGATDEITVLVDVLNVRPEIEGISSPTQVFEDEYFTLHISATDTISDRGSLVYSYDLGDGRIIVDGSSLEVSYSDSGYHDIVITVIDDDGASDSYGLTIYVSNQVPSCSIDVSSTYVNEDDILHFQAVDMEDTAGDLIGLTIVWEMGDGTVINDQMEFDHNYSKRGIYRVRLKISDGDDAFTAERRITVDNPPPLAMVYISNNTFRIRDVVALWANGSVDNPSDQDLLVYGWDFGDGTSSVGISTVHHYSEPGTYKIVLTVTDDDGASDQMEVIVNVLGDRENVKATGGGVNTLIAVFLILLLMLLAACGGAFLLLLRRRMRPPPGRSDGTRAGQPLPPGIRPAPASGGAHHSLSPPSGVDGVRILDQKDGPLQLQSSRIGSLDDINDDNSPVLNG